MTGFEGGCQCGAVRYVVSADRLVAYACHCFECQKQSASAFGISVPLPSESVRIEGSMVMHRRPTDLGTHTDCWFRETCGVSLYHQSTGETEWMTIKGGTFDHSNLLILVGHIWVKRKQPWLQLPPDMPVHNTQPDDLNAWRQSLTPPPT